MKVCDNKEQMFEVNTERIDTGVMGAVSEKNNSKIESKKFHQRTVKDAVTQKTELEVAEIQNPNMSSQDGEIRTGQVSGSAEVEQCEKKGRGMC